MKTKLRSIFLFATCIAMAWVYTSCDDESADPMIRYVRITAPESSDSLLAAAFQGAMVAVIGENLADVREVWFNDQMAVLTTTYVTNRSIIVSVPEDVPNEISDKMTLVFGNGKRLEYPLKVAISEPEIIAMASEFVDAGGTAVIKGDYFYEPLTVMFTGGVEGQVLSVEETEIKVKVPEGAEPGPITVTTNFGETESTLFFRDPRAFLNYDDLNAGGSWRPGTVASVGGLDGNYVILKGELQANQRTEDFAGGGFVSEFWSKANGRPNESLLPGDPEDFVLKFEANVTEWYGSYLNICFAPWDQSNNSEYWSNLNAKAIWGPWDTGTAVYKSNGWITVVIPMTDFKYEQTQDGSNVVYKAKEFDTDITHSLSFWVIGSPKASGSPVDLKIDNVRIVPK